MNKKNNISIKYIILLCMMISFSYKSFGTIIINNLTIWSTPTDITQEIIIERDGFLLITANTRFNSNCFIQVEEGGTLIVENCTLSHNPNDIGPNQQWIGIKIIGNHLLPQIPYSNQGYVYLNNATIADANCAIMAGGIYRQWGYGGLLYCSYDGGGIIIAENTQFINNLKSVQLENYDNGKNISCFKNCDFIINSNASFNYTSNDNQVSLCFVNGIRFQGCDFYNLQNNNEGVAIYAIFAGFLLNTNQDYYGNQLSPEPYYPQQTFIEGFKCALYLKNAEIRSIIILNTIMDDNIYAAQAYAVNTLRFEKNIIQNGNGLFLKDCSKFLIENNYFENSSESGISLISKYENRENNYLKFNTFYLCCNGVYVDGVFSNGFSSSASSSEGLQIQCDFFRGSTRDIAISPFNNSSIAFHQGNLNQSAGNWFGIPISSINIDNENDDPIYYYYNKNNYNETPKSVINNTVLNGDVTQCPCLYPGFKDALYYTENGWITDIGIYDNLYTILKADYDIKFSEYTLNYPEAIDWEAYYNGDDSYKNQVTDYFELTDIKSSMDLYCLYAVRIILSANELDISIYKTWLNRMGCASMDCQLAECFLYENDLISMDSILNEIPSKYSYCDSVEISNFKKCLEYLALWNLAENDSIYISQTMIDTLNNIINSGGFASTYAKGLLSLLNGEQYPYNYPAICSPISNFPSSISEMNDDHLIDISPNPALNIIKISLNSSDRLINNINIFDVYGKVLFSKESKSNEINIDISKYSNGVYFINCIMNDGSTVIKKIIKK